MQQKRLNTFRQGWDEFEKCCVHRKGKRLNFGGWCLLEKGENGVQREQRGTAVLSAENRVDRRKEKAFGNNRLARKT